MALRKWIPVLAVVVLLFGLTSVASAQATFTCTVNNASTPSVRAEGIAELVGDVLIVCAGGTPTALGAAIPQVNIQVFLNTNVTSKQLINGTQQFSEALLLIDDPLPAAQTAAKICDATGKTLSGATCVISGTGTGTGGGANPYTVATAPQIFQGQVVTNNSILWVGIPVDPPGTTNPTLNLTLRITNVRANANQLGVSSTLIPSQILMFISASPSTALPIGNPTQTVAFVQQGLAFSVSGAQTGAANAYSQCIENKPTITATSGLSTDFTLNYKENFLTAFKSLNSLGTLQNTPGGLQNTTISTENGFQPATSTGNLVGAGVATQATRFLAKFAGIPAGVTLYVTMTNTNTGTAAGNAGATLVLGTDASGNGGAMALATSAPGVISSSKIPLFPITSTGTGSGIAVWEINGTGSTGNNGPQNNIQDTVTVGVMVSFASNTAQNLPGLGTATVAGTFAPVSTTTTSTFGQPIPRFADTSAGTTTAVFTINACVTDILFPFVTNQANFDTGIAIANTSLDPFGTTAQQGTCTLYYFGNTTGGGAAPNAQTTGVIAAGTVLTFSLSSGGSNGVVATAGFQGYLIATCNFQFAHGFAFISDLGAQKVAEGYLGLVVDQGSGKVARGAVGAISGPTNTNAESTKF